MHPPMMPLTGISNVSHLQPIALLFRSGGAGCYLSTHGMASPSPRIIPWDDRNGGVPWIVAMAGGGKLHDGNGHQLFCSEVWPHATILVCNVSWVITSMKVAQCMQKVWS